jgi:ferredoxin
VVICANGCLAALDASAVLRSPTLGTHRVIVRLDACAECAIGKVKPSIEQTLEGVQAILAVANQVVVIKERSDASWKTRLVYQAKNPPVSRRDMLSVFACESKRLAARAFASDESAASDPQGLPRERQRLLSVLRGFPPPRGSMALLSGSGLAVTRLAADEKCTACGMCARTCPTSALRLITNNADNYRLTFLPNACTDCGVCLDMCEPLALRRDGAPTLAEFVATEPITLRAGVLCKCQACGAKSASVEDTWLCPVCAFRKRNPFGSRMPPGSKPRSARVDKPT